MATVALVGFTGLLGQHVFKELLTNTKHLKELVLLSRHDNKKAPVKTPDTVASSIAVVNYESKESIQAALEGCSILISVMGTEGDYMKTKKTMIEAAAATTSVKLYIPSDFGVDHNVAIDTASDVFHHACWLDKNKHQRYAESLGLQTAALYIGLFLENPWGAWGMWHGYNDVENTWTVAGAGDQKITMTSKTDIAKAVSRMCALHQEGHKLPRRLRISGTNMAPRDVVQLFNEFRQRNGSPLCKLNTLQEASEIQAFSKTLVVLPTDPDEIAALGPAFDGDYATEIAARIFIAMGKGDIDLAQNDNELLNPAEQYWTWKSMSSFAEEVNGRP